MITASQAHTEGTDGFVLGDLFELLTAGIRAIFAPTEEQIEAAGDELSSRIWSISGPLLTATSVTQFESRLGALATVKTMNEFHAWFRTRVAQEFAKRAQSRAKVRALRPEPKRDEEAVSLRDDLDERWALLRSELQTTVARHGFRQPSKEDVRKVHARFFVGVVAVSVASFSTSNFPNWTVSRLWKVATEAIIDIGNLHRISAARLSTGRDQKRAEALDA